VTVEPTEKKDPMCPTLVLFEGVNIFVLATKVIEPLEPLTFIVEAVFVLVDWKGPPVKGNTANAQLVAPERVKV
jgi:hypothetical protein